MTFKVEDNDYTLLKFWGKFFQIQNSTKYQLKQRIKFLKLSLPFTLMFLSFCFSSSSLSPSLPFFFVFNLQSAVFYQNEGMIQAEANTGSRNRYLMQVRGEKSIPMLMVEGMLCGDMEQQAQEYHQLKLKQEVRGYRRMAPRGKNKTDK